MPAFGRWFRSRGLRVSRRVDGHRLAVDIDLTGVSLLGARERLDQCRLAGAVATDQAEDLTPTQVDTDAIDSVDTPEGHTHVSHLDQRRPDAAGLGCHR